MLYAGDLGWWTIYGEEVERKYRGEAWSVAKKLNAWVNCIEGVMEDEGLSFHPGRIHTNYNSGAAAINLVAHWRPARMILLGYDMMRGPSGQAHHHPDHPHPLANLGTLDEWVRRLNVVAADLQLLGIEVINATRRTALRCFHQRPIGDALYNKPTLFVQGMHGLGDNIHQRALVREWMKRYDVWLETTWPSIYHDLPVHLLYKRSGLRTQAKNAQRESHLYAQARTSLTYQQRVWYDHSTIRRTGSFLRAMAACSNLKQASERMEPRDFSLPIPVQWRAKLLERLPKITKPIMVLRPLVDRTEWVGCKSRNPDPNAYARLVEEIRHRFFVISVADLEPKVEWLVEATPPMPPADLTWHKGECEFEVLAALFRHAALVFCSPGFAIPLAQAVGTPMVAVFGGHESARLYDFGDPKHCFIEPVHPCECFDKQHQCDKRIDLQRALPRLRSFVDAVTTRDQPTTARHRAQAGTAEDASFPAAVLQPGGA